MCGIVAAINKNGIGVGELVNTIYEAQKSRGSDGFGFVEVLDDDTPIHRFVYEKDAIDMLKASKSNAILFHHRIPTSTTNNTKSNHPIYTNWSVYKHNYYLIHNGHISNCAELRVKHEKLGIKYNTDEGSKFTDSESLLHEVALIIEDINEPNEFTAAGGMALIIMQTDKFNNPTALFYGRNHMPIKIQQLADSFVLRSECVTGDLVEINKLFKYDLEKKVVTSEDVVFGIPFVPRIVAPTKVKMIDVLCDIYEYNHVSMLDIGALTNEETKIVWIVANRIVTKQKVEYERKLLTGISSELAILKVHYESTMRTINFVETKLK